MDQTNSSKNQNEEKNSEKALFIEEKPLFTKKKRLSPIPEEKSLLNEENTTFPKSEASLDHTKFVIRRQSIAFYIDAGRDRCFEKLNYSCDKFGKKLIDKIHSNTNVKVAELVLNHEHRKSADLETSLHACHLQGLLRFNKRPNFVVKKIELEIDKEICNMWVDKNPPHVNAYRNYCKKKDTLYGNAPDNHYEYRCEAEENNAEFGSDLIEAFKNNPQMTELELLELLGKSIKYTAFINVLANAPKILENLRRVIKAPVSVRSLNINRINADYVPADIRRWFFAEFCVFNFALHPEDYPNFESNKTRYTDFFGSEARSKALVVHSERGCGKSTFFCNVFNHSMELEKSFDDIPEIVYMCTNLDFKCYESKQQTARLLILDDIDWGNLSKTQMKCLLTGRPMNMNTKYCLGRSLPLPVVVLFNTDCEHSMKFFQNPVFKDDVDIYDLQDNKIGPTNEMLAYTQRRILSLKELVDKQAHLKDIFDLDFNLN